MVTTPLHRLPRAHAAAVLFAVAAASLLSVPARAQMPVLRITSPGPGAIVSGPTRVAATVSAVEGAPSVLSITFFANGRLICTVEQAPYACPWDPGEAVRGHHIRVVAALAGGRRLVENLHTKDLGHTERVRAEAVLVPAIVTSRGEFVRGLRQQDFDVFEDGVRQSIASLASEDAPLELVLAVDISGSMEPWIAEVRVAVKQLMSRLRPGDGASILGFNDTTFLVAEREKDPQAREAAVDLLTPWGGTALYDATVRALDLVSREFGRKGVVLFSDGDDRNSLTHRDAALARVHASDAMLYTIGFGTGATVPRLRSSLEDYARATGGRAFFPREASDLDGVFAQIVAELSNQYVLSYSSTNAVEDGRWRDIRVQVRTGRYDVRARRGYRAHGPQQAGR
jgi:Ca-activated chloride channel homolog